MNTSLKLVFATLCIAAIAKGDRAKSFTKDYDITGGQPVDWYTCTRQGNYPDPRTCDHYIACTAAHQAYQMPCAVMDEHGNRLHYAPESGPDEDKSYCDYPEFVGCSIGSQPPTTTHSQPPTTTHSQPPTTTPAPGGGDGDDCPPGVVDGAPCDEKVDCQQCGDCDIYLRCENGAWKKDSCQEKNINGTVMIAEKLFWNKRGTIHGGSCVHWADLRDDLRSKYREECKPICEYKPVGSCIRQYTYKDPSYDDGYWDTPAIILECAKDTKWSQDVQTCVFCGDDEDCKSDCPAAD